MFVTVDHNEAKNHIGKYAKSGTLQGKLVKNGEYTQFVGDGGEIITFHPGMQFQVDIWAAPGNPFEKTEEAKSADIPASTQDGENDTGSGNDQSPETQAPPSDLVK